jgi:hypothetical protein
MRPKLATTSSRCESVAASPLRDGPAQAVTVRIDATRLSALAELAERDHVGRSESHPGGHPFLRRVKVTSSPEQPLDPDVGAE